MRYCLKFNDETSAREYLLSSLEKKYDMAFTVVGNESYGTVSWQSYFTCEVSPVDKPEQVANARVTQMGEMTDDFALFFFQNAIIGAGIDVCEQKDYLLEYSVTAEASWSKMK